MSTITTRDGTRIYYKDWGSGQPVIFSHGWPLSADAWDGQMLFLGQQGYRVLAHDRRSHGRSDQTWDGNHMDQYADDLAELIEALDLHDVILVGHSTGGGEVTRYVGRHGTSRVAKVVLVGAVPPLMVKSESNPEGTPLEAFDGIRKSTYDNRSQFFLDLTFPFYGYNREGAAVSEGVRQSFWLQGMMAGIKGAYDCIKQFSESDFTEDLIGSDYPGYRNHVYRMVNFCFALHECSEEEREKIVIAGCFHDIGIWTGNTFDYLPPSAAQARAYLGQHALDQWMPEVVLMIEMHHKLKKYADERYPLVEVFRKGDLVDFSLGTVACGLPRSTIRRVQARFPNAGFHKRLVQLEVGWLSRHPWNPLPVFKW